MNKIAWPNMDRSLVAILRGIQPDETPEIVSSLYQAGFRAIEIPLNSPDPFKSIKKARLAVPDDCLVGAGTVITTDQVNLLADAGGNLMVSPNVDPAVIKRATSHAMVTMPGVFSPTEALLALRAGASGLKFFPAFILGTSGIAAIRTILPSDTEIGVVGGVSEASFETYSSVGVRTFGLGSSLYKPGFSADQVNERAHLTIEAYDATFARDSG